MSRELLEAYFEGEELTGAQQRSLADWVAGSPQAADEMLRCAFDQWRIRQVLAGESRLEFSEPRFGRMNLRVAVKRWAAAAAIVVVIAGAFGVMASRSALRQNAQPARVASLIDTRDAVWGSWDPGVRPEHPGGHALAVGEQLQPGILRLKSGSATLEFAAGAQVTLEGPCELGLNSAAHAFLRQGRIMAYCPPPARGFTVGAPGVAIIDLGTRFQMSVDGQGTTEVRVLKGKVEAQSVDARGVLRTALIDDASSIRINTEGGVWEKAQLRDPPAHAVVVAQFEMRQGSGSGVRARRDESVAEPAGFAVASSLGQSAPYIWANDNGTSPVVDGATDRATWFTRSSLLEGDPVSADRYIELTVTPSGGPIVLDELTVRMGASRAAGLGGDFMWSMVLRSSIDGFKTDVGRVTHPGELGPGKGSTPPRWHTATLDLSPLGEIAWPITLRLYPGGAASEYSGKYKYAILDSLTVTGRPAGGREKTAATAIDSAHYKENSR